MSQLETVSPAAGTHQEKSTRGAAHLVCIRLSSVVIRPAISVTGRT
jgi:hypothetical protein